MTMKYRMLFIAVFALLLAAPAIAGTVDQPMTDTAVQTVEAQAATDAAVPVGQAPLFDLPVQLEQSPERCGDVVCGQNFYCCNPLESLCVREGQVCTL